MKYEAPLRPIGDDFKDLCASDLAHECYRYSSVLRQKRVQRTPEQREALADRIAELLHRVSEFIEPSAHLGHMTPERVVMNGGDLATAYGEWNVEQQRATRCVAVRRAVEHSLGRDVAKRIDTATMQRAAQSDQALIDVLREIENERKGEDHG